MPEETEKGAMGQTIHIHNYIMKNMFGFSILLFLLSFDVDDKSYRQVLTPVNNSQFLLKLEILNKFRLVTNHEIKKHKGHYNIF
jgi:hypothetical protein